MRKFAKYMFSYRIVSLVRQGLSAGYLLVIVVLSSNGMRFKKQDLKFNTNISKILVGKNFEMKTF